MTGPTGNSQFGLPLNNISQYSIEGLGGKKTHCFPWGQPLNVY